MPIAHKTGGLRDTVTDFNPWDQTGTGWTYTNCDAQVGGTEGSRWPAPQCYGIAELKLPCPPQRRSLAAFSAPS